MKNERIKELMFKNMISQGELSEILGIAQSEVSIVLKYELADSEQDRIIKAIEDWLKKQQKGA